MMATAARKTNWFAIWVTAIVVVVVVVVGGAVWWMNASANSLPAGPKTASVDHDSGAIIMGKGKPTLDTYIDFQCPDCKAFEQAFGTEINKLVDDGKITLRVHPIAILDRFSSGTRYSTRAANAAYCVADKDMKAMPTFITTMYAQQPDENASGLTDAQILAIAKTAGVTGIDSCVTGGTWEKYVTALTPRTPLAPGQSTIGTPTLAVNGKTISLNDLPAPANFASLFK